MLYVYVVIAISIGVLQLKTINKSMELYEQVDTIPIYQTSLILFNLAAGAIIMQEARLYTFREFMILVGCSCVSILGVQLIIKKPVSKNAILKFDYPPCTFANKAGSCSCDRTNFDIQSQMPAYSLKPKQDREKIKKAVISIRAAYQLEYHR